MRKPVLTLAIVLTLLVLSGIGSLAYRIFFMNLIIVPNGAMMNTIIPGDQLIVTKLLSDPKRGQIVTFKYPGDATKYIGRVVGLPGETIQLSGTAILIDGKQLDEERTLVDRNSFDSEELKELSTEGQGPYRVFYGERVADVGENEPEDRSVLALAVREPYRIPGDSYFLLGDHRDYSIDSRYRGAVPGNLIWGTASVIYWSKPMHSDHVRWARILKRVH